MTFLKLAEWFHVQLNTFTMAKILGFHHIHWQECYDFSIYIYNGKKTFTLFLNK